MLGSGGFGDVYKVQKESAMKTEMVIGNRQMLRLKIEVVVLMKCHEQTDPDRKGHFVAFVDRGKTEKFKFLVMGLVGPSLEDIRKKDLVRNYSKATAMQCCIQTMTALRDLHGIGYLHRYDIKPQNYAIGLGPKESTIYMLDFGIARKFTEGETKKVHFLGTLRFASRACHKQIEQGRKDDLECWLYMVCFDLFDDDKGLPWKRCERNEILAMKQKFFKLENFKRIVQYIDGLNYADEPDYVSVMRFPSFERADLQQGSLKSDETSTDNKQEETGSGEKEEESKGRSRLYVLYCF
ncbi:unnamed protein product [Haemonchus placei]|uniref:Protein kinase domain-containing protein n=1 Tax=Haemonchus placei TaxID=6290 RepID=A0A3P7VHU7_HAEPC|nr:unnamed protein product [Haemonchus placei]